MPEQHFSTLEAAPERCRAPDRRLLHHDEAGPLEGALS
jgi:hypothetical protein